MQVLEWNGIPLTAKTYEEVQGIVGQPCAEAELCVRLWVTSVIVYPHLPLLRRFAAIWCLCTRVHPLSSPPSSGFRFSIPRPFMWKTITLWHITAKFLWVMYHHKFPVWIQTATLICCLTLSTHKPWSTMSSLRLVCTRICLICLACMHVSVYIWDVPRVSQSCKFISLQVGNVHLVLTLSSWLQNFRKCRSSRLLAWPGWGSDLEDWASSPHWSVPPSSTQGLDRQPPAACQALGSQHHPP